MSSGNRKVVQRLLAFAIVMTVLLLLVVVAGVARQIAVPPLPPVDQVPTPPAMAEVERGAYLASAGNCASCHTARGGAPYAGGRAIDTPFGQVFAGNLTPDMQTGIGRWSADAFWRALHQGQSRDGRLLYPAFPYAQFTRVSREDSDAIFAFLRSLPPVQQPNRPHEVRFPYSTQVALAVWRELYFEPADFHPDPSRNADWNRGAYLVQGLGHCAACHSPRDALGGVEDGGEFRGGLMPEGGWYAPSLRATDEAASTDITVDDVSDLLRAGISSGATAMGPMAEVVQQSTQHLTEADRRSVVEYLLALAEPMASPQPASSKLAPAARYRLGERIYGLRCAQCHGEQGEGAVRDGDGGPAYPPLAGNRAVTMRSPVNAVQAILGGGFAPVTADNPQPFGMPPFRTLLNDQEVAAVASFIRQSWGNQADAVSDLDVHLAR
ncbi:MAG: cytochrome c [Burkholderiaceae bacterium]